jgi:hypothetical protein
MALATLYVKEMHPPLSVSRIHPAHQMEAYFFTLLLQRFPFRSEANLLSAENVSSSYFAECQLKGNINSTEDLEEHLEAYARRNTIASEQRQQVLNKFLQRHPPDVSSFEPMRRAPRPNECASGT